MALIRSGGKIVSKDGKLATGQGCCCGGDEPLGTCCEPLCCIFMGVVLWAPNDGTFVPPGGWIIPDAVPGYDYRGDGPLGAGWYREYCPDIECATGTLIGDFEGAVQSVDPYAGTEYEAIVYPINAPYGSRYRNGTEEGVQCGGGVTQSACEEKRGTWYATEQECSDNCGFWACCLPDGSCIGLHPDECAEAGGTRGTDRCENYDCENPLP